MGNAGAMMDAPPELQMIAEALFPELPLVNHPHPKLEAGLRAMLARRQPAFVEIFQQIINGLPDQMALADERWTILAVNPAWMKTAALYGYDELLIGSNYLGFCRDRASEGHTPAALAVDGICQMARDGKTSFDFVYEGTGRWESFAFQLSVNRIEVAGQTMYTVTRHDVTELIHLRQMREGFSHSLIEHKADERRRMAREVHDSTMQLLAAMGLSLGQLQRARHSKVSGDIMADIEQLLGEAQRELRAISYLAHAPAVRELGLCKAVRQLAGGFGRRTGLNITMQADDILSLRPETEAAVYRMVQEGLSNIHRHAHATQAAVGLYQRHAMLHVAIVDNGIGMPEHLRQGVGLSSMRERIAELGGRLRIRSAYPGTMLIASIPARAEARAIGDLAMAV